MATPRAIVIGAVAGLVLLAIAEPAAAAAGVADQVVVSGAVVIPRGAEVGEVLVVHGSARVDGVAHGDVIVVDGPARIGGQVSGNVVALDGRVALGPGAQVNGDVSARGTVTLGADARVGGTVRQHVAYGWRAPIDVVGRFATWLAVSVSVLLLGVVLVLFAPRALDSSAAAARSSPAVSAAWSAAVAIGLPVVVLLALASLVAMPLGLATLLAFALFAFLGYVVSSYAIGRVIHPSPGNRAVAFAIGWAILRTIGAIPVVSGVTFALAAAYGLGAGGVATWRARETAGRHRERRGAEITPREPSVHEAAPLGEEAGL